MKQMMKGRKEYISEKAEDCKDWIPYLVQKSVLMLRIILLFLFRYNQEIVRSIEIRLFIFGSSFCIMQ